MIAIDFRDPHIEEIGLSGDRAPDADDGELSASIAVISADSHFEVSEDIYLEALPKELRDKAPRVWFDGFWRVGNPEDASRQKFSDFAFDYRAKHSGPGLYKLELRKEHRHAAGVQQEVVFPQTVLHFLSNPDYALREAVFDTYNAYISKIGAEDAGRFHGVAVCSNWWDPSRAEETIGRIKALGLKTFMLPNVPGACPSGKEISWGDAELDPFWSALEAAGLPVCFHVVEKFDIDGPGGVGTFMLTSLAPFRRPFAMLAFGGVFDRHPGLKVVFAEGGISWVPPMLQDAEMIYDSFANFLAPRPERRPTQYWFDNCYATFQTDRLGLEQIRYIGVDNVMWASDYPHTEGTYGYTRHAQQAVIDSVGVDAARKILGGNAIEVFKL